MAKSKETPRPAFGDVFARLDAALDDANEKKGRVDDCAAALAAAQQEWQAAVEAARAIQAEYQERLNAVHPEVAGGVTVSG